MPVTTGNMSHLNCLVRATTLTTPDIGGGIDVSSPVGYVIPGDILLTLPSGVSDVTQYSKSFVKNTHGTDSAYSVIFYLANSIDDHVTAEIIYATSTSVNDDATKVLRLIGDDNTGTPQKIDILLNGTSTVNSSVQFNPLRRIEVREAVYDSGPTWIGVGALTALEGNLTLLAGAVEIAVIPAGLDSGTAEVSIGIEATLNGTTTTALPTTAPASISFFKPRTVGAGLSAMSGGTVAAGSAQGIWWKQVITENTKGSEAIKVALAVKFEAS